MYDSQENKSSGLDSRKILYRINVAEEFHVSEGYSHALAWISSQTVTCVVPSVHHFFRALRRFKARNASDYSFGICEKILQRDAIAAGTSTANLESTLQSLVELFLQTLVYRSYWDLQGKLERWQELWHRKQSPQSNWFLQFVNNYRSGSTTWPWTIRPALMILWGVCWCFFDRPHQLDFSGDMSNYWPEGINPHNGNCKNGLHIDSELTQSRG